MSLRIFVSLDGTPQAERALRYAEVLVRSTGGELKLFRASMGGGRTDYIERALESIASRLRETGVMAEWCVVEGNPVTAILEAARRWQADVIAMATTRSSSLDRWLNDGVADAIIRAAEVPVLVVPPDREHPSASKPPTRIMVPLDGTAIAERALDAATKLSRSLRGDLILLRVIEEDNPGSRMRAGDAQQYMQKMVDAVRAAVPQMQVMYHLASGSPGNAIAQAAVDLRADLIAMSTRGRGGLARTLVGSTATATLERSIVPVLLVGPAALSERAEPTRTPLQDRTRWTSPESASGAAAARSGAKKLPSIHATSASDAVEEQGWQSFPASDPPSWTGSTI